jgi:hypothetical protein
MGLFMNHHVSGKKYKWLDRNDLSPAGRVAERLR